MSQSQIKSPTPLLNARSSCSSMLQFVWSRIECIELKLFQIVFTQISSYEERLWAPCTLLFVSNTKNFRQCSPHCLSEIIKTFYSNKVVEKKETLFLITQKSPPILFEKPLNQSAKSLIRFDIALFCPCVQDLKLIRHWCLCFILC